MLTLSKIGFRVSRHARGGYGGGCAKISDLAGSRTVDFWFAVQLVGSEPHPRWVRERNTRRAHHTPAPTYHSHRVVLEGSGDESQMEGHCGRPQSYVCANFISEASVVWIVHFDQALGNTVFVRERRQF